MNEDHYPVYGIVLVAGAAVAVWAGMPGAEPESAPVRPAARQAHAEATVHDVERPCTRTPPLLGPVTASRLTGYIPLGGMLRS